MVYIDPRRVGCLLHHEVCLVSDACLCRMCSHLLVSMSAACSKIELSRAIYSVRTTSPNIQPDLLNPVATGDGQRYRKRSPVPMRWMSPSKTSLRIPQLPRRPAKSLQSLTPRIIRQMLFTRSLHLSTLPTETTAPGQMLWIQQPPRFP